MASNEIINVTAPVMRDDYEHLKELTGESTMKGAITKAIQFTVKHYKQIEKAEKAEKGEVK